MNCPRCGSAAISPSGQCTTCGQAVTAQPSWTSQPWDDRPLPPAVDPYATSAPLTGDPLYSPPPQPDGNPSPTSATPQPYGGPLPTSATPQPYGGPPTSATPPPPTGQPYGAYPSQPYPSQPYPSQPYPGQQPYYPGQQPYFGAPATGLGFSITAFVLAAVAVFLVPIVFGVAAIIFASVARRRGERFGPLALKLAVVGTLLGFVFGALVRII